jgi:hypothetical protein
MNNIKFTKVSALILTRIVTISWTPRRPGFDSGSVHVRFVVDKVALGQVFPEYRCSITCKNKKKTAYLSLHLHHSVAQKPQGCGASVASAAGPFSKKKTECRFISWRCQFRFPFPVVIVREVFDDFPRPLKANPEVVSRNGLRLRPLLELSIVNPSAWSRIHRSMLIVSQLVKKFPTVYGYWRFITAYTRACHLSLSWARSIQSMPFLLVCWIISCPFAVP